MTELKVKMSELAEKAFPQEDYYYFNEYQDHFKQGFRAALELAELKWLASRLENAVYHQEKATNFINHFDDCNALIDELPEDESCQCGMDLFVHNNYISIAMSKEILSTWKKFKGEENV